jgi:Fur family ferric uptake transcriptional regulator
MGNPTVDHYRTRLRRVRVSRTKQRDEVFLALSKLGPCTRKDLAAAMATKADAATVYRTVALLIEIGIAIEVRHKLVELSDAFKPHHHHLTCSKCGKEIGFNSQKLETALREVAESRLFIFDGHGHQVEISGLCPSCQNAAS